MSFNTLKNKLDKYYYEDYIKYNFEKFKNKYNEIYYEEFDKIDHDDIESFNDYIITFDIDLDNIDKKLTKYNNDIKYVRELGERMRNYLLSNHWPNESIRIEFYKPDEDYVCDITLSVYEKLDSHGVLFSK